MALGTDLYLAAQTGTYSSTGPSVALSGGTAFNGFQTLSDAGAVNSSEYYCTLRDASGNSLVWKASYSSTGPTLTRTEAISAIGSISDSAPVSIYVWSRAQRPTTAGLALMEAATLEDQKTLLLPGVQKLHGFPVPYQVSLSYNATTRQVTITPSGATFDIWLSGVKYTKTGAQTSPAHANTTGNYYVYYAADGSLSVGTDPWDFTVVDPVAYLYYNASLVEGIAIFELHTAGRNLEWHASQHFSLGAFVKSGLEISGYTLATDTDAAVTYGIASGVLCDEDIEYSLSALSDGGPYTLLRRTGATDWTWSTASVPFLSGTTYIQYNQNSGGSYQMTELTNLQYVNYWVFATSALDAAKQILVVPSQTVHASLSSAQSETVASLSWGNLALPEMALVWKITYATRSTYTGSTGRVQLVEVIRLTSTRSQLTGNFSAGTHNALTGRDVADTHPASSITVTPAGAIAATTVQAALVELDGEKQPLDATLTALAGASTAADKVPYFTGSDAVSVANFTAAGRALVGAASADDQRALLSVGPGMKNRIIGGDFHKNPWQRGTSVSSVVGTSNTYGPDHFLIWSNALCPAVAAMIKTTDAPTVAESGTYTPYCLELDITTADEAPIDAGGGITFRTYLEGNTVHDFGFGQAGTRYVTLSFWVKSNVTGTHAVYLRNSAGNRTYLVEYSIAQSATWEKKTITFPVDTTGTWVNDTGIGLVVGWSICAGTGYQGTAGSWLSGNAMATANSANLASSTSNYLRLALLQIEPGAVATPFEFRSYQQELALCRRYYRKQSVWVGTSTAHTCFPIDMRATPTVSGGGTGFSYATNTTADTLDCYQTTAAAQTLILSASY